MDGGQVVGIRANREAFDGKGSGERAGIGDLVPICNAQKC
jgi:hypothetical protein